MTIDRCDEHHEPYVTARRADSTLRGLQGLSCSGLQRTVRRPGTAHSVGAAR
jgi:hypothetical protein